MDERLKRFRSSLMASVSYNTLNRVLGPVGDWRSIQRTINLTQYDYVAEQLGR
jgi:hypothetical protein